MSDKHEKEKEQGKHGGGGGHGGGAPHGGGGHEEHEGAPEWMISFADNIALLMGFFVIMLAMNMKPASAGASGSAGKEGEGGGKPSASVLDTYLSIREGFNNPVSINSTNPGEQDMVRRLRERQAKGEAEDEGVRGKQHSVQSIRTSDYYKLNGSVPFEAKATTLTEEGKATLSEIAGLLRGLRLVVEVRGHSSADEAFGQDDRGTRLSYERALTVARGLSDLGLDWRQFRLVACGDNDRLRAVARDPNDQRDNRRVEITVTDEALTD